MSTYTSINIRLKHLKRREQSPASIQVSQLVPERPLPEWILHREKGKGSAHQSVELRQCPSPDEVKNHHPNPSVGGFMRFDFNNMRKDWKSRTTKRFEAVERSRLLQNRQPEPIRPFPGGVRPSTFSSDSSVAFVVRSSNAEIRQRDDSPLEGETTNAQVVTADWRRDTNQQGTSSGIITSKTFLALDQSKLPLEVRSRFVALFKTGDFLFMGVTVNLAMQ